MPEMGLPGTTMELKDSNTPHMGNASRNPAKAPETEITPIR
jgi:hypothetical protein